MIVLLNDLSNLKKNIEREIANHKDNQPINISLEFNENKSTKKDNFNLMNLKKIIAKIQKDYPNNEFKFEITYVKHNDFSIDSDKCKRLEEINNFLIDNYKSELLIRRDKELDRSFPFQSVINANRQIEKIINKVNKAKNDNPDISTFEQFMIIYEEVTDFIYKEEERYDQLNASHWISVVNSDKIVCTGYASLMQELTKRVFKENEVLVLENDVDVFDKSRDELVSAHSNNIIFIKDKKYNINGLFYLDPCWDSIENKDEVKAYSYCCIPLGDIPHHKFFYFHFRNVYQYNLEESYDKFFDINKSKRIAKKIPLLKEFIHEDYFEDKNSLHYYINNYESLDNKSIVPINAYINAFKIIGKQKGLKDEELAKFVKERIEKSIAKTTYYFYTDKCNASLVNQSNSSKQSKTMKR